MQKAAFTIYNASAGSGKTYTLVKEYLKIILTSKKEDAYKNILAITFTNKAVQEMKSRIVDSLFDFSKDSPSAKSLALMEDIASDTHLSISDISHKAKAIIKSIIHNYAAFSISTIDKFTYQVIRSFALDLELPMQFEVSVDTEKLLQEAVDALVAQAGEEEELTKLLVDYAVEKTEDDKSWDIAKDIFSTGKLILNENNREEIHALQDKSIADFLSLREKLVQTSKKLEEETVAMATSALDLLQANGIDLSSFSRGFFPNHLLQIQSKKFNPKNKTYHTSEDIAINRNAKDKNSIEMLLPDLLGILSGIYQTFQKIHLYEAFLKNITPLSLLNILQKQLTKIQEEQNVIPISDFNKLINAQIQLQPAPYIYEKLGDRYKHFFIDEFQDTSELQWQNLIPLIDNALASEDLQGNQGSLLLVGDPKQSIYRWRGGKAEQFIALTKEDNPFSNPDRNVVSLAYNYRSFDAIIHFNNAFFRFLAPKLQQQDYRELYENSSFQKTNNKKGGFVQISFLPKIEEIENEEANTQDDLYLQQTLQTITEVQQKGFALSEIVLLVRSNKKGVLLANYLTQNNIPVISSESLLLDASSEVQFILNMLRFLKDASDKESLAYALYYWSQNWKISLPTSDFIAQGIQNATDTSLETWLATHAISFPLQSIRKKSLYELVEIIVFSGIPKDKNNAYVQFFLDIVLEKDLQYQMSISDFLEFWKKGKTKFSVPSGENAEAIRILSIHKSKGLEFPVVIFPFAEENFSRYKEDKMWIEVAEDNEATPKFLIDKSSKVKDFGDNAKATYTQKEQEDLLDNINVLYVALTRAEEQLYVISSWKERNKSGELPNNLASYFVEFVEDQIDWNADTKRYTSGSSERVSIPTPKPKKQEELEVTATTLPPQNIKIAQREAMMWGSKQQEAIAFGNVMHTILSFIKTKHDVGYAIEKGMEEGWISANQVPKVKDYILQIVQHPELQLFFEEKYLVYNERSILKKGNATMIPDRVVLYQNEAFLLDYKTGLPDAKHVAQIAKYEEVLQEMGWEVKKKVLLYIGEQLEIVNL